MTSGKKGPVSLAYGTTQQQRGGMLKLFGNIALNIPMKSANDLQLTTTITNCPHMMPRFGENTISYANVMIRIGEELQCLPFSQPIHPHLYFSGFSPSIFSDIIMRALLTLINNSVRVCVFSLSVCSGTAKFIDIEKCNRLVGLSKRPFEG